MPGQARAGPLGDKEMRRRYEGGQTVADLAAAARPTR